MSNRLIKHIKNHDLIRTILKEAEFWIASKSTDDKIYLEALGKYHLGYKFNLDNPQTFNEKINWIKLNVDRKYLSQFVDKYLVKKIIESEIGVEYVVPTIAVYEKAADINFDVLPNQFVLKCNHDSGSVIIVRDKTKANFDEIRKTIQRSLDAEFSNIYREYAYESVRRKIICEKYLEQDEQDKGLTDYKFYCFNGEPEFLYVSKGLEDHSTATISFYDMNMKLMPFCRADYKQNEGVEETPEKWNEMIEIARKLSKRFAFVRIDLYCVKGQVYFSEYTFTPCAGLMPFSPSEYDLKIGQMIDLHRFI